MSITRSVVLGVGRYLPEYILTNAELAKKVETSDDLKTWEEYVTTGVVMQAGTNRVNRLHIGATTERQFFRARQIEYNEKHGITPTSVKRAVQESLHTILRGREIESSVVNEVPSATPVE